jgi:hypothetical protein
MARYPIIPSIRGRFPTRRCTLKTTRLVSTLFIIAALLFSFASSPASADLSAADGFFPHELITYSGLDKIEPSVLQALSASDNLELLGSGSPATTDYFVWLAEQADLSPASQLTQKADKGRFVYSVLKNTAGRSQPALLAFLDQQGVSYRAFYIVNFVLVHQGSLTLAQSLVARPDVARITSSPVIQELQPLLKSIGPARPVDIEPNITFINADDAWTLGVTGQGSVLGVIDTGLQWDHPAIIDHYRGWDGTSVNHNYNWWDATGQYPLVPNDGNGHGTMVTGVMVGGDGADNQIGVAPGAETIHCKAINDSGGGSVGDFIECFQWILAPWDLFGADPSPELAPDALNISWGGTGADPFYETIIDTLQMAGILVEASVGTHGPGCATLTSPADYAQVLSTGGVDQTGGDLPGTLSWFSSRGPSILDPLAYIPDVLAPSVNLRSSYPGDDYIVWSGSMALAGAHVTGLVGLIWSANPLLRGNIYDTVQILYETAVPLSGQMGSNCGGNYVTGPNNDWGYGTIDALAAVQQALVYGTAGTLHGTVTDAQSLTPLGEVDIQASGMQEWITTTNSLGLYRMVVSSGTYTVVAELAGYYTEVITGVTVIYDEVTTQDFTLMPVPVMITGTVTDENTGDILAAEIKVSGGWITTTITDPATGIYSLSLPVNRAYTLTAIAPSYGVVSMPTGVLNGNTRLDFNLPTGWLFIYPLEQNIELLSGESLSVPITLTNMGGLSLTYTLNPAVDWLSVIPAAGTLPVSGTLVLAVFIDSAGLPAPGVYITTLIVETDTPYDSLSLPVSLLIIARYHQYLPLLVYPVGSVSR